MGTLVAVVAIYMAIVHGERFLNENNVSSVLLDAAQTGILAIEVSILMIGGGSISPLAPCSRSPGS